MMRTPTLIGSCLASALLLGGCTVQDKMILRHHEPAMANIKPRGALFKSSSFWDLARTVEANAPLVGQSIYRQGVISFSGRRHHQDYDFQYRRESKKNWELLLFQKGTSNRVFSLHRNHLGLTLQDVHDQVFEQSFEVDIWKRLEKHPWFDSLQTALLALEAPKFSPELDWHEEADGLKYYIITRIQQALDPKDAVKHEIYLHKKGKTMNRHIKTKLDVGVVEDLRYSHFKSVGDAFLPHGVAIELPKKAKRVDMSIRKTTVQDGKRSPSPLKDL
jgi:hypothetical protein